MTWLDLYNYLHECANNSKYIGKFPWQDNVRAFDFNSLNHYDVGLTVEQSIKVPDASGKNSNSTETVVLSINQI